MNFILNESAGHLEHFDINIIPVGYIFFELFVDICVIFVSSSLNFYYSVLCIDSNHQPSH